MCHFPTAELFSFMPCLCTRMGCRGLLIRRTHRFAGGHPNVQKRLPRFLLCPALVLRHVAIDTHLVTRIGQSLLSRGGFATLARHLRESHMEEFHMREERYRF